jgi:hypothetical protein
MAPIGGKLKDNGGGLIYPMINNVESPYTIVTFYFDVRGHMTLVKCNKFEVPTEDNPSFKIPPNFYLFVDIYYPGVCAFSDDVFSLIFVGTTCSLYPEFKHNLYKKHKCTAKASMSTYYKDQI